MAAHQIPLFPDACREPTLRDVADVIRAEGIDGLTGAVRRSDDAKYQEVHVRSALTESRRMPFRWALNPYRGCTHGCQYCYARKYQRHLELGVGDDFSSLIFIKTNLPALLARELARPAWTRETVAVGTATDPYQPIEGRYAITRQCLEHLTAAHTPFSVVTKGPMVVRDLDVLARATADAGCQVFLSVPSVDEAACAQLEPGVAPPSQRLRAARTLHEAGIDTGILMMPLMPGITTSTSGLERTVAAIAGAGVRLAGASVGRLDPGVREFFLAFIDREYPALAAGYRRLYHGTHAATPYVLEVRAAVRRARSKAGIPRDGED
jgi:DNA repair photolyase